jgi:RND family efflux transporter MFP subunit
MKKALSILTLSIVFFACGGSDQKSVEEIVSGNNLEEIRTKRAEIEEIQATFSQQIEQLDDKIAALDTNKKIPLVSSFTTKEEVFYHYIELQGNVGTKQISVLTPEYLGVLTHVYVKEGQQVSEGQMLAKIDDGGLSPQLAQLKLQANLAKTTYERQERLWKQKIGSEMQYLQAKTNYETQEKVVNQMEEQIAKTVVKAPYSGVIDEIITKQGNMVSPGTSQLIRIVNLNEMYIEANVPERHITSISKGKKVEVYLPVLGENIPTQIKQVGNYINPANRTFKIEVPLPNDNKMIKPNLTAKIKVNDYTNEKALLIPQSIISENAAGEQYIYVIENKINNLGIAQKTTIETGKTQGDFIEVLTGLKDGAEVILDGARSIKGEQEVKVLNKK